ncbi:MAG: ABC transporter permease [Candidatus Symbiothrix sp.]|jgi:ABC-2 type transport system permease protein|nr:ABC transporter permease [Candidatus Symbiothrix sp.]
MALNSKIGIVIQREYLTRVKKKSFIFMTILMPILFIGLSMITFFLATINEGKAKVIVVADETGEYFPVLKSTGQYQFIESKTGFQEFRKNSDESVYATLVITGDLLKNPDAITLYSAKTVVSSAEETITSELNNYLSDKKLESYNIPNLKQIIEDSKIQLNLKSVKWDDETGSETQTSSTMVSVIGMVFTFLIYMFIMIYGGIVMQGVMEEKNNRIVEVIVSSVKPFDLMMGKLVGIGLVGLTQFGIWILLLLGVQTGAFVFLGNSEVFQTINASLGAINIVELSLYFILFFIGGYLIYSSLFAAIGAIINSPEDSQQYMTPITILILFAFYTGFYSAQNPDGPLAFWTSLFPFTSPIVMMVRIPYGVQWWELSLSIILLFGSVFFVVKTVAKIYRVGILMYGKKPTYKELTKWLKY